MTSCEQKPDHSIRTKNGSAALLKDAKIGPASYAPVAAGATSDYKSLPEGSSDISGVLVTSTGDFPLTGSVSVSGKGKHKFTMSIDANGKGTFAEDK